MIRLLLEGVAAASGDVRAFVDGRGRNGWSSLGLAARAGHAAIVQALLDAGADRTVATPLGKSALELARLNRKAAVVALLES